MITVIPRKITATSVNGVTVANDGSITLPVDSTPTSNSTNLVISGGVKTELDALSVRISNAENPAQVWTDVSFTIPTSSWSLSNNKYTATIQSSSILATSGVFVNYDNLDNAITPIIAEESTGQVTFTTETIPSGTITGTFRIIDSVNGIVPMERGGTGVAATSKDNLLTQLGAAKQSDIQSLTALVDNINTPAQTALEVPFSIAVSSWSGSGPYTATINSSSIVTNSIVLQPNITGGFDDLDSVWSWERNNDNSITFTVNSVPTNTISGTIPVILSINGVVPLARGGTGIVASTNAELLAGLGAASTSALTTGLAGTQAAMGIVEDADTTTHTIAQGQYVIWKGVLYTADAAIASGTTLAASGGNKNLTAVSGGGLNALQTSVDALNGKLTWELLQGSTWLASAETGSGANAFAYKNATHACLNLRTVSRSHQSDEVVFTLPQEIRPKSTIDVPCTINGYSGVVRINTNGQGSVWTLENSTASGRIYLYCVYPI